ncbi:MAG: DUF5685 family protein [Anaerovoracaceae bacterium]|jgi:hypothetical protein
MFGYIVPDKPELRVKDYELYNGYYCGICKSIGHRYGQIPRMVLSYDAVFLALIISSLDSEEEDIVKQRCIAHPIKSRIVVRRHWGIDYAADIMLLIAYFKLLDDKRDDGGIKTGSSLLALRNTFKKIMKSYGEKGIIMRSRIEELSLLEERKCGSLDRAAEPFAQFMKEIFVPEEILTDQLKAESLSRIGYHIGKWIYLIDAYDDIEENIKSGNYNPLIHQFEYSSPGKGDKAETIEGFCHRIGERVGYNLYFYLGEIAKAWKELDALKNKELIENIIYFGLLKKTEQILRKGKTNNG